MEAFTSTYVGVLECRAAKWKEYTPFSKQDHATVRWGTTGHGPGTMWQVPAMGTCPQVLATEYWW